MQTMDGFGRDDVATPFSYGSVSEAVSDGGDRLETKFKRKFWKAKQKMVEKLGREQDHFVVQGDLEIDSHIDSARKLQKSCEQLIDVLQNHIGSLQEISLAEGQMGKYLMISSINEHTSSASTMEKTGKLLSSLSNKRINVVPKLHQLQHDLGVFLVSAVKDLTRSIEQLEKARSDYRAAMLWLRNASTKLDDPDASKQLTKFREAQGTVKQAKEQYDKMKDDVTEKISMLNASRCSLLSRSLPSYQEAALEFFENASGELQTVLSDFKSSHHHQYKIKSEEDIFEEHLTTTTHGSESEDDVETNHPLLDLSLSDDDQAVETKEEEGSADYYVDSSYQAVDSFSQLTAQMDSELTNEQATLECSDGLASATDDDGNLWSKLLLASSMQTAADEATADLNLLKINPSIPLMPTISSTTTSHITTVAASNSVLSNHTSSSAKLRDNWDELFADLDPLSNEKV